MFTCRILLKYTVIFTVEIRGCDGQIISVTINDPANVPAIKEFIAIPVFVGTNGYLREARSLSNETF